MSAIKPGDLVYMAHRICDCSKCTHPMQIPFVVTDIVGTESISIWCTTKRKVVGHAPVAHGFSGYNIPVSVLKKIDPLPEDQQIETDEEMTA